MYMDFSPLIIGAMRLGRWGANFSDDQLEQYVNECLELGLDTFDHADIYGDYTTELSFGKLLVNNPGLRSRMKIITKCGIKMVHENRPAHTLKSYDTSREHIVHSVENSLRNFNTDYLDLLLIHRPDYLLDPAEVAECFTELKNAGKVKAFGVSNFSADEFDLLDRHFPLVTHQLEISLLNRDAFMNGTLLQCMSKDIRPMAWSPVGGGLVFQPSSAPVVNRIKRASKPLCEKYGCDLDQLLYAWLLRHPAAILPVLGTSNIERVKSAKKSLDIPLDREDWYVLWSASTGEDVP